MWFRALVVLLLGLLPQGVAAAQLSVPGDQPTAPIAAGTSCLGRPFQGAMEGRCAELAAAGRLRPPPQPSDPNGLAGSIAPVGQGALVGLGIGLGVGLLTAAIFAHGCEENASQCTVLFIVGGSAFGAGIGAAVGAVVGKD